MAVRIKICGVTSVEDAAHAAELGADALGLNFYPGSPRCISTETASAILRALPPSIEPVAVFVERTWDEMRDALRHLPGLSCVQRHGEPLVDPPPAELRFIPAFAVQDRADLDRITRYLDRCGEHGRMPNAVLVDARVPGQHGGTGRQAPWHLLADFHPPVPLILAGGLTSDNVAEAIRTVRPYMVDVASGVETQPGRKDVEKMKRFIENARNAM